MQKDNRALDDNYICIGWSDLGDLSRFKSEKDLMKECGKVFQGSNQKISAIGTQICKFMFDTKIGDYVIFSKDKKFSIGKVTSNYKYYPSSIFGFDKDYVNFREVKWLEKDLLKKEQPKEFRNKLMVSKSYFSLDDYMELIENILENKNLPRNINEDDKKNTISNEGERKTFDFDETKRNDAINLVVYGTPGCGKSYYVKNTLLKDYGEKNIIRTTFFQDYTNTDFVGQILPKIDSNKSVTYEFNPGPFTLALEQAIKNKDKKVALVIEELNRGNAAAIFGDLFQLLDRKEGVSEYGIKNTNISDYLNEKIKEYKFDEIKLPGNLNKYATMNTADQNVFTLDNAFKRRWDFEKLRNEFKNDHYYKDFYIPTKDKKYTWKNFVNSINNFILKDKGITNAEDKQLGVYFVKEEDLIKPNQSPDQTQPPEEEKEKLKQKSRKFGYKVLEYLWDDVAKFDRQEWFNDDINSLDDLIEAFVEKGTAVFNKDVFAKTE